MIHVALVTIAVLMGVALMLAMWSSGISSRTE